MPNVNDQPSRKLQSVWKKTDVNLEEMIDIAPVYKHLAWKVTALCILGSLLDLDASTSASKNSKCALNCLDLSTFLLFLYGGHTYCRVLIPLKLKKRVSTPSVVPKGRLFHSLRALAANHARMAHILTRSTVQGVSNATSVVRENTTASQKLAPPHRTLNANVTKDSILMGSCTVWSVRPAEEEEELWKTVPKVVTLSVRPA